MLNDLLQNRFWKLLGIELLSGFPGLGPRERKRERTDFFDREDLSMEIVCNGDNAINNFLPSSLNGATEVHNTIRNDWSISTSSNTLVADADTVEKKACMEQGELLTSFRSS